ncbi:MAG: DJ-1/PfpI family protein [Methanospirillum sp.]|uniref:DJ-1/PfpI family protein n=1 Tax=Methanospirillum sp. TaxID=45200 RepID=UPI002370B60D|nr:DJ-1/PfpI family protein [Methanospirillum sp.]MDD1727635.1 DJ-1/PfpI family protein [Methanospirillum sp.]
MMTDIIVLLYPEFETLDVFGPVEVFGLQPESFRLLFYSPDGGVVTSSQQVPVVTQPISKMESDEYILFIPGGSGIFPLITNESFITTLRTLAANALFVLTVCTGSLLLAKTGLLNGRRATSNKRLFSITRKFPGVDWIKKSRWVKDGSLYTSSGVSAGIDMALGFVSDQIGYDAATEVSRIIEYEWHEDRENDPFCELYPD